MRQTNHIPNLSALAEFSANFLAVLSSENKSPKLATVVALSGDLGAGKTTFVQSLARDLGVKEVIVSPTFTIFKFYETSHSVFKTLIHMDAYRIEHLTELKPLRFSELIQNKDALFCIEWAEKILPALPEHYRLSITGGEGEGRDFSFETKSAI